uniref:Antitoxin n=1 Tax=Muribaculaceae bacterium Z82 TaxID=2304548 RepID=A0A7C9JCE6_9BACT
METEDKMTEVIRIRIEPEKKAALTELFRGRGTNVSQAVRAYFDEELESSAHPLDRFNLIMASADEKLAGYEAPEPSIESIVSYVERVREARARDSVA